jgi:hypothetical protein
MKTSIFAMMIAATMVIASCGQKKTEEETSTPIEIIEETPETPVMEEIPSEEVIEGEVLENATEETPAAVSEN